MGIEVLVARTISISAVGPLRIGALNGETADPFADGIFNGKIVSYIMTGRTNFSAPKHHVVKSIVFSRIHALIRNVDRKSTRLNSSHGYISYAVFCLKKKTDNVV